MCVCMCVCYFIFFPLNPAGLFYLFGCAGSLLLPGFFSGCGEQGLLSSCSVQASRFSDVSCRGTQGLGCGASVVAAYGL